jgi:phosphoribosylanthranilate isomerase
MKTRIKICGLTRIDDLQQAVQAGADALGLVFYPPSPRCVDLSTAARLARAVPPFVSIVGLFVNADPALCGLRWQRCRSTCCSSTARKTKLLPAVRSALHQGSARQAGHGFATIRGCFPVGAGDSSRRLRRRLRRRRQGLRLVAGAALLGKPLILSGGLDADNVGEAVRRLRPEAVDVSSGVEASKGIKDAELMHAFVAAVRAAGSAGGDSCETF